MRLRLSLLRRSKLTYELDKRCLSNSQLHAEAPLPPSGGGRSGSGYWPSAIAVCRPPS